jgi:hypothetical protein
MSVRQRHGGPGSAVPIGCRLPSGTFGAGGVVALIGIVLAVSRHSKA